MIPFTKAVRKYLESRAEPEIGLMRTANSPFGPAARWLEPPLG